MAHGDVCRVRSGLQTKDFFHTGCGLLGRTKVLGHHSGSGSGAKSSEVATSLIHHHIDMPAYNER
eukprot:1159846-Pelagomonas_calceolata.AAC.6